mmetsp:Transcript_98971/g.319152  ORF Transcript_98971/g.319152 Transcript_98971/m.319152 type:complete len:105 (+) Transcript_98971:83-397(+)
MPRFPPEIEYSEKYADGLFEYRHVILPKEAAVALFKQTKGRRLLQEHEWRALGVQQTRGWEHYEIHHPEPHILLFRRPHNTDPSTGEWPQGVEAEYSELVTTST